MALVRRNFPLLPSFSPFFDDFSTRDLKDWNLFNSSSTGTTIPAVNIIETDEDFQVEMVAPGMNKDDFHVELDNDMLVISSEKEESQEDSRKSYSRKEFSYQSFRRSFYLPNTVESDKINAQYKDGVLRLVIPKKEEAKRKPVKKITIS